MRIGNFVLHKAKAGVISHEPMWVIVHSCWLYTGETLYSVFKQFLAEYQHDRHLVG